MRRIAIALALVWASGAWAETDGSARPWSLTPLASEKVRGEFVSWFRPPAGAADSGAHRYNFFGNQLRAGARLAVPHLDLTVVGQDTRLVNLPDDASLPPPAGSLGPGALYFATSPGRLRDNTDQGETVLKEARARLRDVPRLPGVTLDVGRFEHADGGETVPADARLAWLKRARIAERLLGPFGYTLVTRSFDGVRTIFDHPRTNLTAIAVRPTHGGFERSASREIGDIGVASVAATLKPLSEHVPTDVRLFYLYYEDRRFADRTRPGDNPPVKVDNRPLPLRLADTDSIAVHMGGAHAIGVVPAGPGAADVLLWGVVQGGEWGGLEHRAWAYAAEAGYQLASLPASPWLRAGYNQSSGDDDPADGVHETFFQGLPTARIYAQLPFYNLMNTQDTFVQLLLKPHPRLSLRSDWHWLRLSEKRDLWYSGGGALNDDVFGFSGIPANAHRELAHLGDVSATVTLLRQLTAYAYYGHAFGQGVVKGTFVGAAADYGYVELTYRY
jgi:Alginate export